MKYRKATSATQAILFFVIVACLGTFTTKARADDQPASTFNNLQNSLALVVSGKGKTVALGTAFCVGSDGTTSYFLTNKHVVGSDVTPTVVLMTKPQKAVGGRVIRLGVTLDVAVIAVQVGGIPPVSLAHDAPEVGQSIGIAGFPEIQLQLFENGLGLSPSLHLGTISSMVASGELIEYDAITDHGNSGGPLFNPMTGDVYGVVTWLNTGESGAAQNNFAIPMQQALSFLENAGITVTFAAASPSPGESETPQANAANPVCDSQTALSDFNQAKQEAGDGDNDLNAFGAATQRQDYDAGNTSWHNAYNEYLASVSLYESATKLYSDCSITENESGKEWGTDSSNSLLALADAGTVYENLGRMTDVDYSNFKALSHDYFHKARTDVTLAMAMSEELLGYSTLSADLRQSVIDDEKLMKAVLDELPSDDTEK